MLKRAQELRRRNPSSLTLMADPLRSAEDPVFPGGVAAGQKRSREGPNRCQAQKVSPNRSRRLGFSRIWWWCARFKY